MKIVNRVDSNHISLIIERKEEEEYNRKEEMEKEEMGKEEMEKEEIEKEEIEKKENNMVNR